MKCLSRLVVLFAFFLLLLLGVSAKPKPYELHKSAIEELKEKLEGKDHLDTVERIREHHRQRTLQMEELLKEKKGYLDGHKAGRIELTEGDIEFYTRQVRAFQQKLDAERNMSDEEYERMLHEKARNLHKKRRLHIPDL